MGFEPTDNGFANRRLGPLGYAARSFFITITTTNSRLRYIKQVSNARKLKVKFTFLLQHGPRFVCLRVVFGAAIGYAGELCRNR